MKFHLIIMSFAASKAMYMIGVSYSKNNFHANQQLPKLIEYLTKFTLGVKQCDLRNILYTRSK